MQVLIADTFQYSGRCRGIFSLARELGRQGIYASIALLGAPPGVLQQFREHYRIPAQTGETLAVAERSLRRGPVDLVHLLTPSLLPQGSSYARARNVPFGVTVSVPPERPGPESLRRPAFVIASGEEIRAALKEHRPDTELIPEGIDVERFRPPAASKKGFRITLVREGGVTRKGALALAKAAALLEADLEILGGGGSLSGVRGVDCGWPPCIAPALSGAQIVAGEGRALLEGMACGSAVLSLGRRYRGPVGPGHIPWLPGLRRGCTGEEPCYRTIFGDLARLHQNRDSLRDLQSWGRRWVLENHDLRLVAELTARVYTRAVTRS